MSPECHFYIDDSGPRDPDRKNKGQGEGPNWFALGGLIIDKAEVDGAKALIRDFRNRWPQMGDEPFRSYDIRHRKERFRWLQILDQPTQRRFYDELTVLITSLPIHVLACVVDRPGYDARYTRVYGRERWKMCRTAFSIVVERAAKVAVYRGARLRVFAERSDAPTEKRFADYFKGMRTAGTPFNPQNAAKYAPLPVEVLTHTLLEFRIKSKTSELMQFADLVLWPVCQGGYNPQHRAYVALKASGKLLDVHCTEDNGLLGTKYSCFDRVHEAQTQEPAGSGLLAATSG